MKPNQRVLQIDGALNFRDLGGYRSVDGRQVRWGKLYRSAQLDRLSEQGIHELAQLNLRTVIDLRFSGETQRFPTIRKAVPGAEIFSWHDEIDQEAGDKSTKIKLGWRDSLESRDPAQVREAMRINYPQKLYSHRAIYRKMLLRLSEGRTPLVFHCAAGKDRTGVAAALVLSLLGISEQQIVDDYLLTQRELENKMETWFAGGATGHDEYQGFQNSLAKQPKELLKPIFDADVNYIKTLLDYVSTTYGSFSQYTEQKLGLDLRVQDTLRDHLLE